MNRVEFRKKILAANDAEAAVLNEKFDAAGTFVVDLVSSPGAGKTSLLEATALRLADSVRAGCVVGDIATELDAERLRGAGLPAHQIVTGGACHLDARLVRDPSVRILTFGRPRVALCGTHTGRFTGPAWLHGCVDPAPGSTLQGVWG